MEIIKEEVIQNIEYKTTTLQDADGSVYVVKDIYEGSKLIDSQILSKDGWMIEDPALEEMIDNFLGNQ